MPNESNNKHGDKSINLRGKSLETLFWPKVSKPPEQLLLISTCDSAHEVFMAPTASQHLKPQLFNVQFFLNEMK